MTYENSTSAVLEEKLKRLEKIMSTRKTKEQIGARFQQHADLVDALYAAKKREGK